MQISHIHQVILSRLSPHIMKPSPNHSDIMLVIQRQRDLLIHQRQVLLFPQLLQQQLLVLEPQHAFGGHFEYRLLFVGLVVVDYDLVANGGQFVLDVLEFFEEGVRFDLFARDEEVGLR